MGVIKGQFNGANADVTTLEQNEELIIFPLIRYKVEF